MLSFTLISLSQALNHNTSFELNTHIKKKRLTFLRFNDDLFMIWTGTKEELLKFINGLSQKHKTIKFDFKYSKTKI